MKARRSPSSASFPARSGWCASSTSRSSSSRSRLVLPNFFILQSSAAHYLMLAALMLAMKQLRRLVHAMAVPARPHGHAQRRAPSSRSWSITTATEDDLATIHLASFPKDIPDDVRRDTASHIARAFSPGASNDSIEGEPMTKQQQKTLLICVGHCSGVLHRALRSHRRDADGLLPAAGRARGTAEESQGERKAEARAYSQGPCPAETLTLPPAAKPQPPQQERRRSSPLANAQRRVARTSRARWPGHLQSAVRADGKAGRAGAFLRLLQHDVRRSQAGLMRQKGIDRRAFALNRMDPEGAIFSRQGGERVYPVAHR